MYEQAGQVRVGGAYYRIKTTYADIAAGVTDGQVILAVEGKELVVVSAVVLCGGTATTVRFRSKPSGDGVDISMLFQNAANGGAVLNRNIDGWFHTRRGEALAISTGAGSQVGVQVNYYER